MNCNKFNMKRGFNKMTINELVKMLQPIIFEGEKSFIIFKVKRSWDFIEVPRKFASDRDFMKSTEYNTIYQIHDNRCLYLTPGDYMLIGSCSLKAIKEYVQKVYNDDEREVKEPIKLTSKYKMNYSIFKNILIMAEDPEELLDDSIIYYDSKERSELPRCLFTGVDNISSCKHVIRTDVDVIEVHFDNYYEEYQAYQGLFLFIDRRYYGRKK